MYRSAATSVAKILAGVRPADLPIGRPVRFELLTKALELTIPRLVLARADVVIQSANVAS